MIPRSTAALRSLLVASLDAEEADRNPVGTFLHRLNNAVQGNARPLTAEDEDYDPGDQPTDPDFGWGRQDDIAEKAAADVADGDGWEPKEEDETND